MIDMTYEGAKDGKHYWLTPPEIYDKLNREFNFDFDPCPHPRPDGFDGLIAEWGKSNYVNPPFKGPTAWVRKAIAEHQKGKTVVFVFPIDKWIHYFIQAGAEIRNLGDIKWLSIEDRLAGKGTGRHIAAFVLRAKSSSVEQFNSLTGIQEAGNGAKGKGEIARLHRTQGGSTVQATATDAMEHKRRTDRTGSACKDTGIHTEDVRGRAK